MGSRSHLSMLAHSRLVEKCNGGSVDTGRLDASSAGSVGCIRRWDIARRQDIAARMRHWDMAHYLLVDLDTDY
jgi:hypothetical protein